MNQNPYQQYRQVQMQTAHPGELLLMLYDGAVRFVQQAEMAAVQRDIPATHAAIVRAQAIIEELIAGLGQSEGELQAQLRVLYTYMHRRLVEANVRKDAARLQEVRKLLEELRDAWRQAVQAVGRTSGAPQQGTAVPLNTPA